MSGEPSSRPRKKAKTAASSSKNGRRKKSLDLLPTMPLDILYEILGQLHPRDIVSLSKANKLFRETLISDEMKVVWKRVLDAYGAPECPSDMKEHVWVEFLFVTACEICGKKNTHVADFLIRRRLCKPCRQSHLVHWSKIKEEVSKEVLDLLPYTTSVPASFEMSGDPERRSKRRHFFRPDVDPMIIKLDELSSTRSAGWREKLDSYRDSKTKAIREMQSSVDVNQAWLADQYYKRHEEQYLHQQKLSTIQHKRSTDIIAKLVELGYNEEDISLVRHHAELERSVALSESIWKRIRPILEKEIHDLHQKRAEQLRAAVLSRRRDLLEPLYDAYRKTLPTTEWKYLPRLLEICKFPPFSSIIDAPSETTVEVADFAPAMTELPALLRQRKESVLTKYRSAVDLGEASCSPLSEVDVLDLAIAVFQCRPHTRCLHEDYLPIIGINDILSHHCDLPRAGLKNPKTYHGERIWHPFATWSEKEFCENQQTVSLHGSLIARVLVDLAGLDPKTARAAEMDQADLRFDCGCDHCGYEILAQRKKTFTWRKAIHHVLARSTGGGTEDEMLQNWSVIPEPRATDIKSAELVDLDWDRPIWGCAHCTAFGESFQTRDAIIEHIKTQHDIPNPKQFQDFIVLSRISSRYFTHHSAIPVLRFMEPSTSKIKRLEEEVIYLQQERDRFKTLANEAFVEINKRRDAFLDLEREYEKERTRRVNLEMSLPASHLPQTDIKPVVRVQDLDSESEVEIIETVGPQSTSTKVNSSTKKQKVKDAKEKISSSSSTIVSTSRENIKPKIETTEPSISRVEPLYSNSVNVSGQRPRRVFVRGIEPKDPLVPLRVSSNPTLEGPLPVRPVEQDDFSPDPDDPIFILPLNFCEDSTPETSSKLSVPKTDVKLECKSEDAWILSSTQTTKYLEGTPCFSIKPLPIEVAISRKALNEGYGLPIIGLFWKPETKPYRFLLPTYDVNPQMPRTPGEPGLLLSCRNELRNNGPWTLFIRIAGPKVARLNYAGEYTCRVAGEMTPGEFAIQGSSTKAAWGEKISTAQTKNGPYTILRARMTARKRFGHEPTEEQVNKEARKISKREKHHASDGLTSEDVVAAFERGEERITVVKLVCVSYSHDRAREYAQVQTDYEKRNKSKGKPGKRKADSVSSIDSPPAAKKVKLKEKNFVENDSVDEESSDSDS